MVDTLPSRQEIEVIFNSCSNGDDELSPEQFKDLCYRLFLAPTNSDVIDLYRMYEKDKLSIDEVLSLIEKQWEPIAERKRKFIDDLRTCRKGSSGPLTRDELCEILTKGDDQNHDRLTEEDLVYVFQELSIHEDQLIDEEELTELIFKIEVALSRAQSRLTQHDAEETQDNLDTGEPEGQTQQSESQEVEPQQSEAPEGEQQQEEAQEGQQQQSEVEEEQQAETQETTDAEEPGQTGETTEGQTMESSQQQDAEQDVENNQGENDSAEQGQQESTTEQTNNDDNKQELEEQQGETTEQSTSNEEKKTEEQSQNNVTDTQAENTEINELDSQQKSE